MLLPAYQVKLITCQSPSSLCPHAQLFVICNAPLSFLVFVTLFDDPTCLYGYESKENSCVKYKALRIAASDYNAAGFPLMMILRKRSLKDRFQGYITSSFRAGSSAVRFLDGGGMRSSNRTCPCWTLKYVFNRGQYTLNI